MTSSTILVAGAVATDLLMYHLPASLLSISDDSSPHTRAQMTVRKNGADLIAQLLTAASTKGNYHVVHSELQTNGVDHNMIMQPTSITELACELDSSPSGLKYSVVSTQSIARPEQWETPSGSQSQPASPCTIIFSGSGEAEEEAQAALDLLKKLRPARIIYYMTAPLGTGRLWDKLRGGPDAESGIPEQDNLFAIIEADDLRGHGINLSQGLSWEATSEDFVRNLGSNGRLDTVVTCPHLLVRFGTEGVIYHRGRDAVDPKLFFNPRHSEGSSFANAPSMLGLGHAFTAGFAHGLTTSNTETGIQYGLASAHNMSKLGFVPDQGDFSPNYPVSEIMQDLQALKTYPAASIPSNKISTGERWLLLDQLTGDPTEVARQIVTNGPDRALGRCPTRQYGDLISTERAEIENLGYVSSIIDERLKSKQPTPTCIGVFGPANSGKTFTATNFVKHIEGKTVTNITNYDSRLLKEDTFTTILHDVRDASAVGALPVIIFKNFESVLMSGDTLVDTLPTLMSEGTFLDRTAVRHLGHAIIFFLVNQDSVADPETPFSPTTEFGLKRRSTLASMSEPRSTRFEDSPLIDLLHGTIKVAGPNFSAPGDKTFPIRRALMLRHILKMAHPHLEVNGKMTFDDAVLHALLLTPTFKNGLSSLQKIISTSRLAHRAKFDVSALPPEEQIQLHVDGKIFMSFLRAPKLPPALREILAQGLFQAYKKQRLHMCQTAEERKKLEREPSFRDWDELPNELKESTRAQADDIPRKLRAIDCFMLNDGQGEPRGDPLEPIKEFGQEDLLMLSEMEHERFNAERLQRQWRMGPRNAKQRTTPFLVPWRDLTQEWKDVDTVMVECVPRTLEKAGYRIYRMKD